MVTTGDLRKVTPRPQFQQRLMNQAGETIAGATTILEISPSYAFTGAYDAARHCIDAWLNHNGLRAKSGDGAHRVRAEYVRLAMTGLVTDEDISWYSRARTLRNQAEYPEPEKPNAVGAQEARAMIELAKRFHKAVSADLKQARGRGN
jgi:uncharacterized protein (UPF0332 family)